MELLTVKQTAALLQLHKATVYGLIRDGHLPALRVGHELRVNLEELKRTLAKRRGIGVWMPKRARAT